MIHVLHPFVLVTDLMCLVKWISNTPYDKKCLKIQIQNNRKFVAYILRYQKIS